MRHAAKYVAGAFSALTAVPSTIPSPTNGHMCTNPSVNYGCEHFGVGYYGTPTAVKYTESPSAPGTLIHGPAVNVATPSWTYYPPAPAQPAQVQAVILAPPPPPAPVYEFGDAVWVKAIVTTSHNNAVVELKDLVSDDPGDPNDPNWRNGEPDEVEVEWQILQTEFNNPNGVNNELAGALEELPNGDEVVTRRYEFYKYTGLLDPETNEAKCDRYPQISDPADPSYKAECDPAVVTVLGDYIGAQMAGFNVEAGHVARRFGSRAPDLSRKRPVPDLLVERGRLRRWLDPDLRLQGAAARRVLGERAAPIAFERQHLHDPLVSRLVPALDLDPAPCTVL